MAKENMFLKKAHELGLLDERDLAFAADSVCTNGNRGRAWFFINGSKMFLYEMAGMADMGDCIEVLDLSRTKFVKGSGFVLHTHMTLEFGGHTYKFQGFAQGKRVIQVMQDSCRG
jgi:hypothetical protein